MLFPRHWGWSFASSKGTVLQRKRHLLHIDGTGELVHGNRAGTGGTPPHGVHSAYQMGSGVLWTQPGGVEAGGGENLKTGRKPREACKHFWAPFQNSNEVGNH